MKTTVKLNSIVLANALFAASLCAAPQSERLAPSDADRAPLQMEVVVRPGVAAFRVRLDDADAATDAGAWVAILISDTERARPLDTDRAPLILDTDTVLAYGRAVAGRFDADFAYPISDRAPLTHALYVQPVAVDRDGRIRCGEIAAVRTQFVAGDVIEDGDDPVERAGASRVIDTDGDGFDDIDGTDRVDDRYDGPPMAAWVIDAKGIGVEFTVPSNDYALFLDFTRTTENGCDVFLFLEEPGEGQGLLDVVEYHGMSIGVNRQNGNLIRVFVARARRMNSDRSGAIREYKLAAQLRMPQ